MGIKICINVCTTNVLYLAKVKAEHCYSGHDYHLVTIKGTAVPSELCDIWAAFDPNVPHLKLQNGLRRHINF